MNDGLKLLVAVSAVLARSVGAKNAWLKDCRTAGYDPNQLACETCLILPKEHHKACGKCCQKWLDTKRITKPYQAAILVDRGGGTDQLEEFLEKDWDEVVAAKSSLQHIKAPRDPNSLMAGMFAQRFASPNVQVLFFDEAPASTKDIKALEGLAVETFPVRGMKRDDIKDMLLTLLV